MNGQKVTRKMMIEAVNKRTTDGNGNDLQYSKGTSFADRGYNKTLERAIKLYNRLVNGDVPSTQEVVAYFGKGARFVEGE